MGFNFFNYLKIKAQPVLIVSKALTNWRFSERVGNELAGYLIYLFLKNIENHGYIPGLGL
jgi:hypothetical protein